MPWAEVPGVLTGTGDMVFCSLPSMGGINGALFRCPTDVLT